MKMQIYLNNLKSHTAVCVLHENQRHGAIKVMFPSRLVVMIPLIINVLQFKSDNSKYRAGAKGKILTLDGNRFNGAVKVLRCKHRGLYSANFYSEQTH